MLKRLSIQNYALIDSVEIDFSSGLNILTGETGAGKSLLMGALNLLLGARADSSVLSEPERKAIIEGWFDFPHAMEAKQFFIKHDLDVENEINIRRELLPNAKSRAFINDTPVSLNLLKELGTQLVDLHQQFDTLELSDESFQRSVLDAMAGTSDMLNEYSVRYKQWMEVKRNLESLEEKQRLEIQQRDYQQFLLSELQELNLTQDELENAATELKFLEQAESVKLQLSMIYHPMSVADNAINIQLRVLLQKLSGIQIPGHDLTILQSRMQSALVELKDIASELEHIENTVSLQPEKLQQLQERLNTGYRLLKKHQVQTTAELLSIQANLELSMSTMDDRSKQIEEFKTACIQLEKSCRSLADQLTAQRKKPIAEFVDTVTGMLKKVGMPQAVIQVDCKPTDLQMHGQDTIQFLFDGNRSGKWQPIGKVASGGELSRIMLVIKSMVAQQLELPTLIFDEIDSGISGEATRQVGIILRELAHHHQILVITHQPQIAARSDNHFLVYKTSGANGWKTSIRKLQDADRLESIAQMLDGENPSDAARAHARELMDN
jgi:DNA repair protein RecN (Recombination protein N)